MSTTRDLLRLNVGFIRHQTVGYSREFPLDLPSVSIGPDLNLTDLVGSVFVTRTAQGLLVKIVLRANVFSQCVRCLADFSQPLEADFTELYAFAANSITDSGLLLPENGIIDLGPIVREEMLLAIPISSVCRPDCKGLCPVCGENLNETECHHDGEDIDLRLSVLKSLLKDN